ncbi:MAG: hypothetical protein K8F62_17395, partial [Pseudorhodoplanes sp.]|nr:hypothetical protein [Pseudorhodoplanes sp.]
PDAGRDFHHCPTRRRFLTAIMGVLGRRMHATLAPGPMRFFQMPKPFSPQRLPYRTITLMLGLPEAFFGEINKRFGIVHRQPPPISKSKRLRRRLRQQPLSVLVTSSEKNLAQYDVDQ